MNAQRSMKDLIFHLSTFTFIIWRDNFLSQHHSLKDVTTGLLLVNKHKRHCTNSQNTNIKYDNPAFICFYQEH